MTPGPWFTAAYGGECACCGDRFNEGDDIRADGQGGYACCTDDDPTTARGRRDPFVGTTDEEMGY